MTTQATTRVQPTYDSNGADPVAALIDAVNKITRYSAAVDPASLAAGAAAETDVSIAGVKAGSCILVQPPSDLNAGIVSLGARCAADGTVKLRLLNTTSGAVDVASKTWTFVVVENDLVEALD